nr:YdcF family protein [Enterococcus faecalis]
MHWLKITSLSIVSFGFCILLILGLLIFTGKNTQPTDKPDAILILGARVLGTSKETALPSRVLQARLDVAIPYIKQHPETPVIVSGGQGADEPATEAAVMKQYLLNKGVPEKQILLENRATRTKENIVNSEKLLSFKRLVIVTSDFHMYRSQLLAKRAGISNVSGITAASSFPKDIKNFGRELLSLGYALLFYSVDLLTFVLFFLCLNYKNDNISLLALTNNIYFIGGESYGASIEHSFF